MRFGVTDPALRRVFPRRLRGSLRVQVLQQLEERHPGATAYHFIEDKLSTLEKARRHRHTEGVAQYDSCKGERGRSDAAPMPHIAAVALIRGLLVDEPRYPDSASLTPRRSNAGEQAAGAGEMAAVPRRLGLQHPRGADPRGCRPPDHAAQQGGIPAADVCVNGARSIMPCRGVDYRKGPDLSEQDPIGAHLVARAGEKNSAALSHQNP